MKKSSGSPSRVHSNEAEAPLRQAPPQTGKERRGWIGYLAAGGAIIILILLILPCQLRKCGGTRDHGDAAYRWIMSGVPAGTTVKKPHGYANGADRGETKKQPALKRAVPGRDSATDKQGRKDVSPVGRQKPVKIEKGEQGAMKPKDRSGQAEKKNTDGKNSVKPIRRPVTPPDLGTKLELVPAPERH
jgi:hypothetical protein